MPPRDASPPCFDRWEVWPDLSPLTGSSQKSSRVRIFPFWENRVRIFPFWENMEIICFRIFGAGIYSKNYKINIILTFFGIWGRGPVLKRWGRWLKSSWGGLGGQNDEFIFEKSTLFDTSQFLVICFTMCCDFLTFLTVFTWFLRIYTLRAGSKVL